MTTEQMPSSTPPSSSQENIVEVRDIQMYFPVTSGIVFQRKIADVKAVDGVTFDIRRG